MENTVKTENGEERLQMGKRVELPSTTETWRTIDTQGQNKNKTPGQQKLYQVCAHVLAPRAHSSPVWQMLHVFLVTNETNGPPGLNDLPTFTS